MERPGVSRGSEDGGYRDLLGPPSGSGGGHAEGEGAPHGLPADPDDPDDRPVAPHGPAEGNYGDLLDPLYELGDADPVDSPSAPRGPAEDARANPPASPPEPGSRRRRDRPDLLVASGPPRRPARRDPAVDEEAPEPAERPDGFAPAAPSADPRPDSEPPPSFGAQESGALQAEPSPPVASESEHVTPAEGDSEPAHRVGRPPGGRPTRPDLLVAQGPSGRRGAHAGRHHRPIDAPSAVRRSTPVRRRRGGGLLIPLAIVVALALVAGGGLVFWGWVGDPFATGPLLAADEAVRHGDADFAPLAGVGGNGSSQVLNAVASDGSLVVAVGSDTTGPVPRPLFLVSSDGGASWRLGAVTGAAGYDGGPVTVGRVAGGDGRWLAGGDDPLGAGKGLWTSTDGHTWTAVDPEELKAFSAGDQIMDLARTSSGFVAVGTAALQDGTGGAVAWVSPDGRSWSRVEDREIGPPDKVRGLKAVVAKGDVVVALGDPAPGKSPPVVLRSADGGKTWTRIKTPPPAVTPEPGALAVAKDGFVLVPIHRRDDKGEVEVYCSPQGTDWSRCGTITGLAREGSGVKRLASSSAGVAAITESGFERYAVHTSESGRDWRKTTDLGEVPGSLRALAVSDGGTLVVGGDERAADVDNRLVLITAPKGGQARPVALEKIAGLTRAARDTARVTAGGGRFVAVGSASGDAGVWTSADGRDWKTAGSSRVLGGTRRQALTDVASGRRGWLAVGSTMTDASSTAPLLVTSTDAKNWRGVPVEGPLAPAAEHDFLAPHAVAAGPSGYVLAGEDRGPSTTVPVLWFSSDLKRYSRAVKLPAGGAGVRLYDVSATSSGYTAVGGMGTAGRETGVVWVSADGVNWAARKPVLPPGATSAGLRHVVSYGGTVVAAGTATTADGQRAFGAVSVDNGSTWEFSWLAAEQAAVEDLAATAEGVVAVGWQGAPGERESVAWTSGDGREWRSHSPTQDTLEGEGAQWFGAVAISGDRVVALGRSTTYDTDHLTLWRATLTPSG